MVFKKNKYRNIPITVDGMNFDSKAEYKRYAELITLQKQGKIRDLNRQVSYRLTAHGKKICVYIADFDYYVGDEHVTEDYKGMPRVTPEFRIKANLFEAQYGRKIVLTSELYNAKRLY